LKHFEAWASAIPKLVHLRELDFENVNINHVNDAMATLKASVRKKGSLHVLNPPLEILIVLRVHETLILVLQAFLSRNKMLPKLLAKPQSPSSCEANEQQTTHVPVFPTLFVAALPAERFALHNVLTGLLSASEDIGY
jgi:hypothetical protein